MQTTTQPEKVTLKLRVATREDFANENGTQKYGTIYLHQNKDGNIEPELHRFAPDTNMKEFKLLYHFKQIFVPMGVFEIRDLE
jgi:hypothetical protein